MMMMSNDITDTALNYDKGMTYYILMNLTGLVTTSVQTIMTS